MDDNGSVVDTVKKTIFNSVWGQMTLLHWTYEYSGYCEYQIFTRNYLETFLSNGQELT